MTELITKIDWDCCELLGELSSIKDDLGRDHPSYKRLDKTEDRLIQIGKDLELLRRCKTNEN
jgi:hypothetical protein